MMAVWPSAPPSSVATPGQPRGVEQRGVGRAQALADQHRAFRHAGEAAERRRGEVAHQTAGDLAHFLGATLAPGGVFVVRRHGENGDGDLLAGVHHRGFGADQHTR